MATKTVIIYFELPGDQDWDPDFWDRIGESEEWEQVAEAFEKAGAGIEDCGGDADMHIECKAKDEKKVRKVLEDARSGKYGEDVKTYYSAAKEAPAPY